MVPFDHQLSYWKDKLYGKLPLLELPTDRPRPPVQSYHGAAQRFHLPASLTQDLKSLSQSQGVTLQATLMAAFLTLLWRYTRQEDILIGAPHPNRDRPEFRELVGPLMNMLVLRNRISSDLNFRQLINQVHQTTLDALSNQDFPFERLLDELEVERSLSHNPLFQVMFEFKSVSSRPLISPAFR